MKARELEKSKRVGTRRWPYRATVARFPVATLSTEKSFSAHAGRSNWNALSKQRYIGLMPPGYLTATACRRPPIHRTSSPNIAMVGAADKSIARQCR